MVRISASSASSQSTTWEILSEAKPRAPVKVALLIVHNKYGPRRISVSIPAPVLYETGGTNGPRGVSFAVSETGAAIMQDPAIDGTPR